jgi:hypothetical protein
MTGKKSDFAKEVSAVRGEDTVNIVNHPGDTRVQTVIMDSRVPTAITADFDYNTYATWIQHAIQKLQNDGFSVKVTHSTLTKNDTV